MAKNKANATNGSGKQRASTEPKFPYTTKPSSLRRLLQEIPKKPKPPKFDKELLKAWGFSDANDYSMIRVLKAIGLLGEGNQPTPLYSQFMQLDGGSLALAEPIKKVYAPMFVASHTPYKESLEKLQNLFNIHSGGGERSLDQQIQTFKALCENASFETPAQASPQPQPAMTLGSNGTSPVPAQIGSPIVATNINVHIHLPENKTRRDYEAMIEDIGRYIFGRADQGANHE